MHSNLLLTTKCAINEDMSKQDLYAPRTPSLSHVKSSDLAIHVTPLFEESTILKLSKENFIKWL